MTMTAGREMRSALAGAFRLARGDRGALELFDRSLEGFWHSFRAAFICYPFFLLLLTMRVDARAWEMAGGLRIVIVETIGYVIAWTAFPLIMLSVTRWIGRADHFFEFMVPYNWCQVPQSLLFVVIGIETASGLSSPPATQGIELAAAVAVLVYEWFIARVALDTSGGLAAAVVAIDLVLGTLIDHASVSLY